MNGDKGFKKFLLGGKLALPVVAGYLPLGFACGVICAGARMSPFEAALMSLLVFAGAAQYIAAGMISAGAAPASIIVTTLIVNMRHLLYSSALYPYLTRWSAGEKAIFAYEITDETFALHASTMAKTGEGSFPGALGINVISHGAWVCGNFFGCLFGGGFSDAGAFGFDFALPALFIALLIPRLTDGAQALAAAVAGSFSLIMVLAGASYWAVIAAALAGSGAGVFYSGVRRE